MGERDKHFAQQLDWSAFPNREFVSDFTEAGLWKTPVCMGWEGNTKPQVGQRYRLLEGIAE